MIHFPSSTADNGMEDEYVDDGATNNRSSSTRPFASVDDLMAGGGSVLPRKISFKKSATAFSSAGTGLPPAHPPQQKPIANGVHKPQQQQRPQTPGSQGQPRQPLVLSPSFKQQQQQQQKQQHQQQSQYPRPSTAPAPGAAGAQSPSLPPVVRCKDPNEFRWPKRYLYPSSSVRELLRHQSFDKVGRGLSNLGNTCFLNSVLQALAYTPPLSAYMRRKEHSRHCRVRNQQQPDAFCLFCALEQTCNSMTGPRAPNPAGGFSGGGALSPNNIVRHLRLISRSFRLGRQEDSHEFLRFSIELLQKNDLAAYGGPQIIKDLRVQETTALFGIFGQWEKDLTTGFG
jgi:hypothetical protein